MPTAPTEPDDSAKSVHLEVELSRQEAWEFAQFLKRVTFQHYQELSEPYNKEAPYLMVSAGEKIAQALAHAGFAPR